MPSDKQSPFLAVWNALTALVLRDRDMSSWQNARLSEIEDRLAALDGGHDADAARRHAVDKANATRIANGADQLGFRLTGRGADTRIEWIAPEAKVRL